jgi:hypothetical protein
MVHGMQEKKRHYGTDGLKFDDATGGVRNWHVKVCLAPHGTTVHGGMYNMAFT